MSVLLDISRLYYRRLTGRLPTGIDRVGLEYLRHYAGRARAVLGRTPFLSVLAPHESARAFRVLLAPPDGAGELWALGARGYLRWWTRPDVSGCVLLNTSHTGLENPGYAASLRRRGARPVFFVHDLIPITHPEYCRPGERDRHVTRIRTAVTTGAGIIVPSQHTLDTLRGYCGEQGLPLPPAAVAPLASSLPSAEAGPRPLAAPYFVVIGTIEARKNLALLLEAWRVLIRREGGAAPRLVVIGQRGWGAGDVVRLLESDELRGHVIERANCPDVELVAYLRHAQALLFPSFSEGYGLPLAEALAFGVPAIASDLAVFREVAGDVPEYAGPRDAARWTELAAEYARPGSDLRAGQLRRLAGFRATSWTHHFQSVDAFLERI
jgi:glycosyltransferase involved in cell wall biosynthesis